MSDFKLYLPILKVDKENRTVSGYATTESIDKQGEVVDYAASKDAFAEWGGNLREMHEAKAVGKAVEVVPDDKEKRVFVKAYISKGAEDTWQKVKEGVLTGFSIGGNTIDKVVQIVKDTASNAAKQVTRITKYKLNELSLVDNPANPEAVFTLVKMDKDGLPHQTELVEDIRKVVATEVQDPLESEVKEYKDKSSALEKKILSANELQDLSDDDFGLIRKYTSPEGAIVKERILAIPDKVHAYAALRKIDSYRLNDVEKREVHEKAKKVLGSSHKEEECTLCKMTSQMGGVEIDMAITTEQVEKLTDKVSKLAEALGSFLKAYEGTPPKSRPWEGGHSEVENAKATPEGSVKSKEATEGEVDAHRTQPKEGAYPVKGPVKAADMPKSEEDEDEEKAEKRDMGVEGRGKETPKGSVEGRKATEAEAADYETQPMEGAYPAKGPVKAADMPEMEDEEEDSEDEPSVKTYKRKTVKAAGSTEKAEKSTDLRKLAGTIEALQKRLDAVESRPLPRKYKVEKTYGAGDGEADATPTEQIRKDYDEIRAWQQSNPGKELPVDLSIKRDRVLNKMIDGKFGSDALRKV